MKEKRLTVLNYGSFIPRPVFHFTADTGWINDPNGLVCHNGRYHFYFQYNPFDTEWGNMSWGHAVSDDLLHWEQAETVLWPDSDGTVFSGSAIVNEKGLLKLPEDALLYFYTAAGGTNGWSAGKEFTQKMAYSMDGGFTLNRLACGTIGTLAGDNRDPKVFRHEESGAFVMVLWVKENEFAVFRSEDLNSWEESSRFFLDGGFECPDLVRLADGAKSRWVVITAAGHYYPGSFDGYAFVPDGCSEPQSFRSLRADLTWSLPMDWKRLNFLK